MTLTPIKLTPFNLNLTLKKALILLPLGSMALAQSSFTGPDLKTDAVADCCFQPSLKWSVQKVLTLPVLPDLKAQQPSGKQVPQALPNYRPGTYRPIPIPTTFPDAKLVPLKIPFRPQQSTGSITIELLIPEDAGAQRKTLFFK